MIKIKLDDQTREQLLQKGELQVEDTQGVPIVLMTVDARQELQKVVYDDSDLTEDEMLDVAAKQLDDPEGWGAPSMEIYDQLYGDNPTNHGDSQ